MSKPTDKYVGGKGTAGLGHYLGPCTPPGTGMHHNTFTMIATDLEPGALPPGLTRDELLQKVWGRRETHRDRTVDVFVRRLRQKIDRIAPRHSFIQTRFGVGYKLEPDPK